MSWHHRYIGNPLITWLLNTFYKVGVSDSQCGFRALTRQALERLRLEAAGMEFLQNADKSQTCGTENSRSPHHLLPKGGGHPVKTKKPQRRLAPRRVHPHVHTQTPLPTPRPRPPHCRNSAHDDNASKR